ncbi:vegetative cell wall protein gp1 [Coffea eugenioides]|uniref:vegetative cell wall protein gp1 n=1 Tax=Coffea eugenioides TaxID=49369 RepID=UPI000F615CE3|nr:vegetative cell wall protein gp1 [Coffea eugenioides]
MLLGRRRLSLVCRLIFFISFVSSEARTPEKLPSAVVVGAVYCDTCFQQGFSKDSHFISGASVAVECGDENSKPSFREVAKTNEHGEFKVHLPLSVSKHVKKIKGCSVKLISSSEPYCAVASTATSSSVHLKSRKDGTHIFSAGFFSFKPLNQPALCVQKPIISRSNELPNTAKLTSISDPDDPNFSPPIQDPPTSDPLPVVGNYVPPLPQLPNVPSLPTLPPLPPLPGLPNTPVPAGKSSISNNSPVTSESSYEKVAQPSIFNPIPLPPNPLLPPPSLFPPIPNPFQPPPSILPPVIPSPPPSIFPPIFPSPPPSIFPPIFPSPPTPPPSIFPPIFPSPPAPPRSLFPPLVPLPGSTPSPPPPSPPSFPLPPFPFQPVPGLPGPGVPPAVPSSSDSEKSSP